jgi:hypothetical protein
LLCVPSTCSSGLCRRVRAGLRRSNIAYGPTLALTAARAFTSRRLTRWPSHNVVGTRRPPWSRHGTAVNLKKGTRSEQPQNRAKTTQQTKTLGRVGGLRRSAPAQRSKQTKAANLPLHVINTSASVKQPYWETDKTATSKGDPAGSSQPKYRRPASVHGHVGSM